MEQEKAGDGADGDGQRVDGGHHQHSASTSFYLIVVVFLTEILKRNLSTVIIQIDTFILV